MKIVLTTIIATATLWAVNATVKYDDVKVKIGDKTSSYKQGEHFEVAYNQKICLLTKGDGLVSIEGYGQIDEYDPCGRVEKSVKIAPETTIRVIVNEMTKTIVYTPKTGAGVRDDTKLDKMVQELMIDKNATEIIIENKTWGPLPITLTVMDKNGKERAKKSNKSNSLLTHFVISNQLFQEGDKFVVTNKNGDRLAEITVKFKK